jgi:hypothetical protein
MRIGQTAPSARSIDGRARTASRVVWLAALVLAGSLQVGHAVTAAASPAATPRSTGSDSSRTVRTPSVAKIIYLAGGSVYVEAGREQGLAEGDTLTVLHEGRVAMRLRVSALSSGRAVCDTFDVVTPAEVGDRVAYVPHADDSPAPAPPAATPATAAPLASAVTPRAGTFGARRWRGRVGLRYLDVSPESGGGYSQPAFDLRLDGRGIANQPVDLLIDFRTRHTYHAGEREDLARVYRMALALGQAGGRRITIGRQLSPALSAVSMFDGALAEFGHGRWSSGVFAGTQPEPLHDRPSSEIFETGAYVQTQRTNGPRSGWTMVAGGVGSLAHGQVNRQFGFVNTFWFAPRMTLSGTQEIDLNTGWRRGIGEPVLSFSSTFISARTEILKGLTLNTGYDGRRNVRLYRDRLTPETEFDDAYRRGVWAGASSDLLGHVRMTVDGRWNGDGNQLWQSTSGTAELFGLPPFGTRLRYRATTYRSDISHGDLQSGSVAIDPLTALHLEWTAGVRTSTDSFASSRTEWQSLDADLRLTRRLYLTLTGEQDRSADFRSRQAQAGLSWLF